MIISRFKIAAKTSATFSGRKYRPSIVNKDQILTLPTEAVCLVPPTYDLANGMSKLKNDLSSVILYMASNGARVNEADRYGLSPLHHAAMRGNDDAAKELLICPDIDIEVNIFDYRLTSNVEIFNHYKYSVW